MRLNNFYASSHKEDTEDSLNTFYLWIWGILSIYFIKEINFLFVSHGKCLTGKLEVEEIQVVFIQRKSREFFSKYFCQSELAELSEAIHQIG